MVYRIDKHDKLVFADGAFQRFAAGVGEPDLPSRWLGQPLWHCIADEDLRAVYIALVGRARAGHPITIHTRCDSPAVARALVMEITAVGAGVVEFRCSLSQAQILTALPPSSRELLLMCAWCYRVDYDGWREIEDVLVAERLLERPTVPLVTHGICDACMSDTVAQLDELGAVEAGA